MGKGSVVRINRFLAEAGIAARRKADLLIAEGRVSVNGRPARTGETVDPATDTVLVDGIPVVRPEKKRWYLLNKPAGVLSAVTDRRGRRTVVDLLPSVPGLFPVGRLDREVTGVLLLTTDGDIAHRLTHPGFGVTKVYRVTVAGRFPAANIRALQVGVEIAGHLCHAREIVIVAQDRDATTLEMTLAEGRKHEVKELVRAVGGTVLSLERIAFAGITVNGLRPGGYRPLTDAEVVHLKQQVGLA